MRTLRDVGVYVTDLAPVLRPVAKWLYSRLPQGLHDTPTSWLESHFGGEREVTFIQVGAYDGVAGDPMRPLVLAHPKWQGALIEPMPAAFAQLKNNYAGAPHRVVFLNCAVSDFCG